MHRNSRVTRRQALQTCAGLAAAAACPTLLTGDDPPRRATPTCTLGFGAYGIPGRSAEEALRLVAGAGYDSIELTCTADRDTAPEVLDGAKRTALRGLLRDQGLRLTSLMEHVAPLADEAQHLAAIERLKRATQLALDLSPDRPPVVQTVLGGKDWGKVKDLCRERLAAWRDLAEQSRTVICIKPHRGNALSRPDDAVALLRDLGDSPWLRMVYDYSHFAFRDMPLDETVRTSLPVTAHIAVKDPFEQDGKVEFALPGEKGTVDYAQLLKLFYAGGYRGDVCVEVSSQVWKRPDYDVAAALASSYRSLDEAFRSAGVPRPARG
jgi:sugar phosphate isomerase/epimerase